jgi:hypothetical protein
MEVDILSEVSLFFFFPSKTISISPLFRILLILIFFYFFLDNIIIIKLNFI